MMSERAVWCGVPPEMYKTVHLIAGEARAAGRIEPYCSQETWSMVAFILGFRVGQMATQIIFTGTVADNDDAEFPFVAVVAADGQVLARYRTSAAGRAKLDEAFAMLNAQAATQTDAARYNESSDIIAWLDATPHTETAAVISAQRKRAVAEQMEIAKRRLTALRTDTRGY
jgi:hypothetical protein